MVTNHEQRAELHAVLDLSWPIALVIVGFNEN